MNQSNSENPYASLASQLPNIDELFESVELGIEQERPAAYATSGARSGRLLSLDKQQKLQLSDALTKAFTPAGFDLMLDQRVDKKRYNIVADYDFRKIVHEVIEAADREDWTANLIRGALEANPNNPQLLEFVTRNQESDVDPAAPYVRAAAVLCTFEPELLKPLGERRALPSRQAPFDLDHPLYTLVGHSAMVINVKGEVRSCLRDDVRREALTELIEAGQVEQALKANFDLAFDESDTAQRVFRDVLTGSLPSLTKMRLEDLTALQHIAPWVSGVKLPVPFPPAEKLRYHVERERLLDPFRRLIGRWEGRKFVEHFRGRKKELRELREYVDVAESESFMESATRVASGATAYFFNLPERPPLVIHGPGGAGKSTLMAKFLLQHAEAHQKERFPFAYIDFDRPDVSPVKAHTLLGEIAHQLAMQYPEAEQAFLEFRRRMQDKSSQSESLDPSVPVSAFRDIAAKNMEPGRPLLLVLDTFEEVQQRSRDEVHNLFIFLDRFQGAFPMLRTVMAGRAPVTKDDAGFTARNYALLDLDEEAALGFLLSRGIGDENEAAEIISLTGRQPLALKLAADVALDKGVQEVREAAGGSGMVARFRRVWSQTDITGRLYQRLLNHITDPEARKLAHPGLVLRRITPEIIRDVLAEPCGMGVIDDRAADELFERLQRQVSLVAPAEPGVLRHRADVRQMMLPLILKAEADAARLIQERAIKFYEAREGTAARAEEIYHRLMLGESPRSVETRWVDGLKAHLSSALDELPLPAQAFVAARIEEERPNKVWLAADIEDWELYAEQRIRKLLAEDEPERAEEVLRQRSDRSATSRLLGLEALVLQALGRRDEALTMASRALELFLEAGVHQDLVKEFKKLMTPPDDKPSSLFDPSELGQILEILRDMSFMYSGNTRQELFNDIPRDYLASIPVTALPMSQLSLDLNHLNNRGKLPNGSHPMVLWLKQAVSLMGNRPQAKALQAALTKAHRRVGSRLGGGDKGGKRRMK